MSQVNLVWKEGSSVNPTSRLFFLDGFAFYIQKLSTVQSHHHLSPGPLFKLPPKSVLPASTLESLKSILHLCTEVFKNINQTILFSVKPSNDFLLHSEKTKLFIMTRKIIQNVHAVFQPDILCHLSPLSLHSSTLAATFLYPSSPPLHFISSLGVTVTGHIVHLHTEHLSRPTPQE